MFEERLLIEYFERIKANIPIKQIIKRELAINLLPEKAISIVGPRRAGKTYYLYSLLKEDIDSSVFLDFEATELSRVTGEDVLRIISMFEARFHTQVKKVFLDEIQSLSNWSKLVRSLLDRGLRVYLTGSSSKLLPKELSTELRGRTLHYILLPFSFREFLAARNFRPKSPFSEKDVRMCISLLEEYLEFGGFPEVVLRNEKERLLKEYKDAIFYRDFVERHKIKSIEVGKLLFEYVFQNFAKEISIDNLSRFIEKEAKIKTKNTIYRYIDKIQDTMAVFFMERFSQSVYRRKKWPKKAYICDVGFNKIIGFSPNFGRKMENVVFLELLRETNEKPLLDFFYWRDYQGREVDFVIKEGLRIKELIQVTYASGFDEIEKREIRSLIKASEIFKRDKPRLRVITWDYEDEKEIRGKKVKFVPLWKWLLKLS